jgi:hypothetical protein
MKTVNRVLGALLLLAVLLAGCGRAAQEMTMDAAGVAPLPAVEMAPVEAVVEESFAGEAFNADAAFGESVIATQDSIQERLIIRTGDMSIVVVDTEDAMNTIAQMVDENGGWVVSSNVFQYSDDAMTGNMVVRVPAEGFDSFLEAVRGLAVEVTRITTSGQDVTEEYVDLSARLENLEATADRVRTFLDDADTVEEALAVNAELSRLEGEIAALKGRLQYLDQSAAFSSVTIDLTPDVLSQPLQVDSWQPEGAARNAFETLIATLQALVDIAIWFIIYVLPVLLIIAIPTWLVIRYFRRRRAMRRATAVETAAEESVE